MNTIHCDYCGIDFQPEDQPPPFCPNCLSPLPETTAKSTESSLELVYQKTGARIRLSLKTSATLGRTASGKEIFAAIPQISRNHCRIDLKEGCFYITDLKSTNGTFIGAGKINCLTQPEQKLHDGEILYLGREPFLIQLSGGQPSAAPVGRFSVSLKPEQKAAPGTETEEPAETAVPPAGYECQGCHGFTSPTPGFTCPKCRTWNE